MPGENAPVDETGLINPDAFPCKPETLDPETINSAGDSLSSMGIDVVSRTTAIRESWSRLPDIYKSPEQEQVYSLMLKTTLPSFDIRAALVISGSAIQNYANTMTTIKKDLQDLEKAAREFREEAQAGYDEQVPDSSVTIPRPAGVGWSGNAPSLKTEKTDWRRHQHAVDKNNEFVAKYNAIYVKITQAVSECADKINKTDSTMCIPAPPTPTLEELEQMGPMPWGAPGERQTKNCADSFNTGASRFFQGAWDSATRLAGFDEHGWNIGNTWNTIWGGAVGITDLGTSLVVSVIATPFIVWGGYKPSEWERERLEVFTRAGTDLVGFDLDAHWAGKDGWHKWKNDPVATGTELGLGLFGKAAALKTLGKLGLLPKIPHPTTYLRNQIPRFTAGLRNLTASLKDWMHKGNQKILEGIDKLGETADKLADELRKRHGRQPAYVGGPSNGRRKITNNFDVVHHTADPTPGTGKRSENPAKPRRAAEAPSDLPRNGHAPGDPGLSDGDSPAVPGESSSAPSRDSLPERKLAQPTDGTSLTAGSKGTVYDPDAPVRKTISAKDAAKKIGRYTPDDVQRALDRAPRNADGQPVDHRNGRPLKLTDSSGHRGWVMRYDEKTGSWLPENRSLDETGMPAKGTANSYGYDSNGDLLPYANERPKYSKRQIEKVWRLSRAEQLAEIRKGTLNLPKPGWNQLWVKTVDDIPNGPDIHIDAKGNKWRKITWNPKSTTRDWDMGHIPKAKYSELRDKYLSGNITKEKFLTEYRNPKNYRVEDPMRNRSHIDE